MTNRLQPIMDQKKAEIAKLTSFLQSQPQHPIAQILQGNLQREREQKFKQALQKSQLAVIAEIKRKSPSKGALAQIMDPIALAQTYIDGGAAAISILTDEKFFNGKLSDLQAVSAACSQTPVPLLRKDFIVDASQIAEAVFAGADAILAIVAVLGNKTQSILSAAQKMNIEVLVEVHNLDELMLALDSGAEMIGINNRDLTTFEIDVNCASDLIAHIPESIVCVAESGVHSPILARQYRQAGFDAVLIGEALVKSDSPQQFIRACCYAE